MSAEAERVVVMLDASRDVSPRAIEGIRLGLSLEPGDTLTFLGILHPLIDLSESTIIKLGILMGYTSKKKWSSIPVEDQKIIDEAIYRKEKEYNNNEEIMKISRQCEAENIEFNIKVQAGTPLKMVAVNAAKSFEATWVILDRHIKKDRRYFLERLSCKISRIKSDNSVKKLRGLKTRGYIKLQQEKLSSDFDDKQEKLSSDFDDNHVTYDEMIRSLK